MSNEIIAHIWTNGNTAEKGSSKETSINTCIESFTDTNHRESIRNELERCFTNLWSAKAKVLFVDELTAQP